MNQNVNQIKQRLSLRIPLAESLELLATLLEELQLEKPSADEAERKKYLEDTLSIVKNHYPTCSDFEREFPSLCFSIATGVGKTRLMGAFITYLYLEKGIRNFFILAPNITIYEKLIEDFNNPLNPKYVFTGISKFVNDKPVIITGDNYNQMGDLFEKAEVRINIFNISKFNREATSPTKGKEKGSTPRIKRLSEYLGQSYWDYLSGLEDLVVLMDEAHRYHADASQKAINELKPILGLELTATPFDEKGNQFKNVVYEYSLAKALTDGLYVKIPAIATRKDFDPKGLSDEELEKIKLEDAISIHQDTKNELEIYSLNNKVKLVKPFILVVCKDTTHAKEVYDFINSDKFYDGQYIGKVLQIDSTTKNEEDIERQFVTLENPENGIEIVIHVNMLKEGWDVTNLYTIVPLRAANASVLVEQTIGRGLRLPYNGSRTGDEKIDKLTVVAHENFNKVIEAAKNPNSILNKMQQVVLDPSTLGAKSTVVTSVNNIDKKLEEEKKKIEEITDEKKKQVAQVILDAKTAIVAVLPEMNKTEGLKKVDDFSKPEIKKAVLEEVKKVLEKGQTNIFKEEILVEAEKVYNEILIDYKNNIIEIPRMDLLQGNVEAIFKDFDLDVTKFNYKLLEKEIIRTDLVGEPNTDYIKLKRGADFGNPAKMIVSELINHPEIDYDSNSDLLFKLSSQCIEQIKNSMPDSDKLPELIFDYKRDISNRIYEQMKENFEIKEAEYLKPNVRPFTRIEDWNFAALEKDGYKTYTDDIKPVSLIPKYIFRGFKKACHRDYKFHSKTEKDFAIVLEQDPKVLKWLRPAPNQFHIYYPPESKQYYPDFVVETANGIYLVETKSKDELQSIDVKNKMKAALKYCQYASEYTEANGGKKWGYLLIPHDDVKLNASFEGLESKYLQK